MTSGTCAVHLRPRSLCRMALFLRFLRIAWRIAAGLAGFFVIEIGTTVGFEPLGGIIQVTAPLRVHVLATLVAIVSGLLGGIAASVAGGGASRVPVLVTSAIVAVESAYVIIYLRGANPVWFELGGGATLLGATLVGGLLVRRWLVARRRSRSASA